MICQLITPLHHSSILLTAKNWKPSDLHKISSWSLPMADTNILNGFFILRLGGFLPRAMHPSEIRGSRVQAFLLQSEKGEVRTLPWSTAFREWMQVQVWKWILLKVPNHLQFESCYSRERSSQLCDAAKQDSLNRRNWPFRGCKWLPSTGALSPSRRAVCAVSQGNSNKKLIKRRKHNLEICVSIWQQFFEVSTFKKMKKYSLSSDTNGNVLFWH